MDAGLSDAGTVLVDAAGSDSGTKPDGGTDGPVDIMVLIDLSAGEYRFDRHRDAFMAEIVDPMLRAGDVRIGIATFSDFPVDPYGAAPMDFPFRGNIALTNDLMLLNLEFMRLMPTTTGDGPSSALEALYTVAGGGPHPTARPFSCPAGRAAGGCWRPDSTRIVILIVGSEGHNLPSADGSILHPYFMLAPPPATPAVARAQLIGEDVAVFILTHSGNRGYPELIAELGEVRGERLFEYFGDSWDAALRNLAAAVVGHAGL